MRELMLVENWITDGRSLLGLGANSASWIAHLYKCGAKEIKVQIDDDVDNIYAVRITLPITFADQKLFLLDLVSLRPSRVEAALDDADSNAVWLRLNP